MKVTARRKEKEINPYAYDYVDVDQHEYEIFVSKREAKNNSVVSRALGHQINSRAHIIMRDTMYKRDKYFRCVHKRYRSCAD
eukprot:scaffold34576_cov155-Skeletonema_dohrnii-CCMP3373.AAC.1